MTRAAVNTLMCALALGEEGTPVPARSDTWALGTGRLPRQLFDFARVHSMSPRTRDIYEGAVTGPIFIGVDFSEIERRMPHGGFAIVRVREDGTTEAVATGTDESIALDELCACREKNI